MQLPDIANLQSNLNLGVASYNIHRTTYLTPKNVTNHIQNEHSHNAEI